MTTIEESIDVGVPVHTAYNQWTQFEEFPRFMEGVERIEQQSDNMTHWTVKIGGVEREFDAKIVEQLPDERVAWRSTDGANQAGVVTFHKIDPDTTRIMLQLDYDPEGFTEKVGDALGIVKHRAKGDLKRFKDFIEEKGSETGAWRGSIE